MAGHFLIEIAVRPVTGLIFHLNGGVCNLVMMNQKMLDARQQPVMIVRRDHLYMQGHDRFFPHHPHVYVMDVSHFRKLPAEVALQRSDIQRNRGTFQQLIHAICQ